MDWLEFLPVIHLAWASLFRRSANFEAQPWALTVWPKRERAASRGGSWSGPTCHSGGWLVTPPQPAPAERQE